jgi:hypothetical protein
MRALSWIGWALTALDLVGAAVLFTSRPGGDAATRGLGAGLGAALAALGAIAALLLWSGRAPGRGGLVLLGSALAAAPVALGVVLTISRNPLGLIYPALRDRGVPKRPSPKYAFPDAATREAALAIVYNDYAKLDSVLQATPRPDLAARDELGGSLLGLAIGAAIMDGGAPRDLEGLRLLLAAGATPRADERGPGETVLEVVAGARSEHASVALEMLLDAGMSPDMPMEDGRSVLFHPRLTAAAARVLLARGADRTVHDTRGGAADWSPVTYQADLRNWATALVLLEGGVPRDHGTPPGSVLARVLRNGEGALTDEERADPAYAGFIAAAHR